MSSSILSPWWWWIWTLRETTDDVPGVLQPPCPSSCRTHCASRERGPKSAVVRTCLQLRSDIMCSRTHGLLFFILHAVRLICARTLQSECTADASPWWSFCLAFFPPPLSLDPQLMDWSQTPALGISSLKHWDLSCVKGKEKARRFLYQDAVMLLGRGNPQSA